MCRVRGSMVGEVGVGWKINRTAKPNNESRRNWIKIPHKRVHHLRPGNDPSAARNALLYLWLMGDEAFSIGLQYPAQHWTHTLVFYKNHWMLMEGMALQLPELQLLFLPHVFLCYTNVTGYFPTPPDTERNSPTFLHQTIMDLPRTSLREESSTCTSITFVLGLTYSRSSLMLRNVSCGIWWSLTPFHYWEKWRKSGFRVNANTFVYFGSNIPPRSQPNIFLCWIICRKCSDWQGWNVNISDLNPRL